VYRYIFDFTCPPEGRKNMTEKAFGGENMKKVNRKEEKKKERM
jgi:hypothetical protein